MKKGFAVAGMLFLLVSQASAQKPVSFLSEYIDFAMEGDYFSVNGIYVFLNRTDKPVHAGIQFPFALPATMVDSIGVMNLNEAKSIAWKKRERDILFNVSISPFDSVAVHLYYRQPLGRVNSYILTSTRTWGDPLEKAVYTLTTDKNLVIRSFSFPPDSFLTDPRHKTYYWNKADFDPPADFEITIERD
jgi:hypothetical protein